MDIVKSLSCRELKRVDVVDTTGEKIGRISDMTFTFDGEFKLSQFILAGSAWEEFLESIKVKPDKDPIFDASLIQQVGGVIQLNTSRNSLKTTLDECAIRDDEFKLSDLENKDIVDSGDVSVGKIIDIDFDEDGSIDFTVGGGLVEETLESLGLRPDIDIIVPATVIDSIGEKIKLIVKKTDLKITITKALDDHKTRDQLADSKVRNERLAEHEKLKVRLSSYRTR
ncbi:MAG: PRC-barrel domain-containing protein [Candidatus Thorarchaeota archaeon]